MSRFGGSVLSQINPLSEKQGYGLIECAAAAFDIDQGMATTPRGVVVRDQSATWLGQGQVNLKNEKLRFDVSSKAREGLGLSIGSLASIVRISGTLAQPSITPNPTGVAQKGAEAFLALSTGGMSVLAKGLFDRATSDGDVCEQILHTIIVGENPDEAKESEY